MITSAAATDLPRRGAQVLRPLNELIKHLAHHLCIGAALVGHPDLIGRTSSPVAFSAIPQKSVLGLTPMPASRAIIQTHVLRNQIIPSETLEVDTLLALRMALEAGLGCALLSRATVLADLAAEKYHARRIVDPPLSRSRSLSLVALAERPQTKAFLEVRKTTTAVVRAAVDERRWPAKKVNEKADKPSPNRR